MDLAPNGGGQYDERAMMAKVLEPDRLYVTDREYQKFALFNQVVAAGSSYVCRLRDNSKWEVRKVISNHRASEIGDIMFLKRPGTPGSEKEFPSNPAKAFDCHSSRY